MPKRIVEISGQISNGMWSYNMADLGGLVLPEIEIKPLSTVRDHGYEMVALTLTVHSGTYLETASHLVEGRRTIDQVDVSELFRPAKLVRLPKKEPHSFIYGHELEENAPKIEPGDALLIDSSWGEHWDEPGYVVDNPCYHPSCLEWLMEQPMSILGVDMPIAEAEYVGREVEWARGEGEIIAPLFREKDVLLLAPVILNDIRKPSGQLIVFPLNIKGVCAAPCRAVYIEEEGK